MQSTIPVPFSASGNLQDLSRTASGRVLLTIASTGLLALCAHVSLPLYFTPVPLTLQTMAVLLIGFTLGPALGFSAMVLYLAEGAIGLPVFSPNGPGGIAQLLGPTAGYLFSYPLAAATAGVAVRVIGNFRLPTSAAAAVAGLTASLFIFTMGACWLAHLLRLPALAAWHLAIAPFLPGEILKIAAASGLYASLCRWRRF